MLSAPAAARADEAPTTRPSVPATKARPVGILRVLDLQRKLLDRVDLTDDQKNKIDSLFDKAREDLKDLQATTQPADDQTRARVRETLSDLRQGCAAVLTDEQKQKLKTLTTGRRPGQSTTRPATTRPATILQRISHTLDQLQVTPEQRDAIQKILNDTRDRMVALRDSGASAAEIRDKAQVMGQEMMNKIDQVLTPEQREKLRDADSSAGPRK